MPVPSNAFSDAEIPDVLAGAGQFSALVAPCNHATVLAFVNGDGRGKRSNQRKLLGNRIEVAERSINLRFGYRAAKSTQTVVLGIEIRGGVKTFGHEIL